MAKKRKTAQSKGKFVSVCKKCEENFTKITLWGEYWKGVEKMQKEVDELNSECEKSKAGLDSEISIYKKIKKEHSNKIIVYAKQLKETSEYKNRLNIEIKTKSMKLSQLEKSSMRNEQLLEELEKKKNERKAHMDKMKQEIEAINESNRDFGETEANTRTDIKNLINSIYQKKNWQREAIESCYSHRNSNSVHRRGELVSQPKRIVKNTKKYANNDDSCRCVIF